MRKAYRQRRRADTKALPIQFRAVASGIYESTLEVFNGPWACAYRIYKTEHKGHGTSHSGRTHWHTVHVPTGQTIAHDFNRGHPYELTLDGAIHTLHLIIGRGLVRGFEVLASMNTKAQQELATKHAALTARNGLELKIRATINAWKDEPRSRNDYDLLVKLIADVVQP